MFVWYYVYSLLSECVQEVVSGRSSCNVVLSLVWIDCDFLILLAFMSVYTVSIESPYQLTVLFSSILKFDCGQCLRKHVRHLLIEQV